MVWNETVIFYFLSVELLGCIRHQSFTQYKSQRSYIYSPKRAIVSLLSPKYHYKKNQFQWQKKPSLKLVFLIACVGELVLIIVFVTVPDPKFIYLINYGFSFFKNLINYLKLFLFINYEIHLLYFFLSLFINYQIFYSIKNYPAPRVRTYIVSVPDSIKSQIQNEVLKVSINGKNPN